MQDGGPRFREFHEKLLQTRGRADKVTAMSAAKAAGYDTDRIQLQLVSDEVKTTIAEVSNLARALAINGTPTFFVGRKVESTH
jgi:protein-disulfide isomerase